MLRQRKYIEYSAPAELGVLLPMKELPALVDDAIAVSQTLSAAVDKLTMFIRGGGLDAPLGDFNEKLDELALSLAKYNMLAIELIEDAEGHVIDFNPVSPRFIRFFSNDEGEVVGCAKIVDEQRNTIERHPLYDVGVGDGVKYSHENRIMVRGIFDPALIYPVPLATQVLLDAFVELSAKKSTLRDAKFGFAPDTIIFEYSNSASKEEDEFLQRYDDPYSAFAGSDAAKIMRIEYTNPDFKPEIVQLDKKNIAQEYDRVLETAKANIFRRFGIPEVLYGIPTAGKLGSVQEMRDAIYYTEHFIVRRYRDIIERALADVLSEHVLFAGQSSSVKIKSISVE